MKEVMKRIDQNGTFRFSSSDIGQQQLFEFNDAATAAKCGNALKAKRSDIKT
jgi:hypothetical protein